MAYSLYLGYNVIFILVCFILKQKLLLSFYYFFKGVKRRLNLETLNYGYEDVPSVPVSKRMRKWSNSSAGSEPSPAQSGKKYKIKNIP